VRGRADLEHPVGVLGVVVVDAPGRGEGVVDAIADGVAQLLLGHAPVQGEGGDEVDVVDARGRRQVEHGLDHPLAVVGPAHRGQGERHVVEGDRELHASAQQLRKRFAVEWVQQRLADGLVGVLQGGDGLGRVDHPAALGRQPLEAEALAVAVEDGRGRLVDLQHETWPRHQILFRSFSSRRSKAMRTAPREPALAACSMASVKRDSG
jgi:hypothetical protein